MKIRRTWNRIIFATGIPQLSAQICLLIRPFVASLYLTKWYYTQTNWNIERRSNIISIKLYIQDIIECISKAYRKTSNISRTLERNKIVDNSDVVGASPVGAAPTTSSIFTLNLTPGFNGLSEDNCKGMQETFKFGDLVRLILQVLRYSSQPTCNYPEADVGDVSIITSVPLESFPNSKWSETDIYLNKRCVTPTGTQEVCVLNSNRNTMSRAILTFGLIGWELFII